MSEVEIEGWKQLHAYHDGELSGFARWRFERRLRRSPELQRELAALTRIGEELPLPVRVKGVCDLAGFSFWIQIDSHVAELVRVEQTPFLAGKPPVDTEFVGLMPGAPRQTVAGARVPGSGGVDGVGTLARLIFRGRNAGATRIQVIRLKLRDPDGEEIPSFAVPVRLTVMPGWDPRKNRR